MTDPFKLLLKSLRQLACSAQQIIHDEPGPLPDEALEKLQNAITAAALVADELIDDPSSPLYTSPAARVYWMPIGTGGMTLAQMARTSCAEADRALATYCASEPEPPAPRRATVAAEAVWKSQSLFCHILGAAGVIA